MRRTLEGPGRKRGEKWLPFFPPRALLSACVRINMQGVKVSDKTITRETSHVETIEEVDMVV